MGKLILVRHGQTDMNVEGIYFGWLDPALNEKGREQGERAKEVLRRISYDNIYSSDLKRASETARLVNYLKKELVLDYSKLALKELEDEDLDILGEESVIDYLEEIASITPNENPEGEDFIVQNLPLVASIAFNYLREGVAYLDVVQEGTVGFSYSF